MKSRFPTYFLLATCALLIFATLGWMTRHLLQVEKERAQALVQADLDERLRLALLRMDSLVSAFLLRENARPPGHYQPIDPTRQPPEISPLLGSEGDYARLYFEIGATTTLQSPQHPLGKNGDLLLAAGYPIEKYLASEASFLKLQTLLAQTGPPHLPSTENLLPPPANPPENQQAFQSPRELLEFETQRSVAEKSTRAGTYDAANKKAAADSLQTTRNAWNTSPPAETILQLTGFSPHRLGGELFLFRRIVTPSGSRLQGVWLKTSELEKDLLAAVANLFPNATLEPVTLLENLADPSVLVTLPLRLRPRETAAAAVPAWTPMRKSLALGWLAVLAALLGALCLIRAVMNLSERRAAFVSSVTHELRTPLTTFRLYSEMLVDDFITDPSQRRSYLRTMMSESERLQHLVENVLAFARLEKGSARRKTETLTLPALLEKISPVLHRRTNEAGATLRVAPAETSRKFQLDPVSIEQILFNLIDNACKYGLPSDSGVDPQISLTISAEKNRLLLTVRDSGPGIPPAERKRLFRPFHKSAQAAAESKPGVGLGLALSRRLARALGGDLRLDPTSENGSVFTLELPVTRN